MKSLQGNFLVASPKLGDSNFLRTVVLMIQHDEDGAMGLVLNRPTETTIQEVWQRVVEEPCDCTAPVYIGGPVPGPLIAVHNLPDCSESEVLPGVFVATQRATLERLFETTSKFRLFSGYSGWGGGQLEDELKVGGWLLLEATADRVFADPDGLWKEVTSEIGQDILGTGLDAKHVPDDPSMN